MVKGIIMEPGMEVLIGDTNARKNNYTSIAGKVCIYVKQGKQWGNHFVRSPNSRGGYSQWVVQEVDMFPVGVYETNKQALRLLRKG